MKRFKKMMAIAIVAVMTMMYVVPMSFAADPTYKITVSPSGSGATIEGKTFKAYKLFDVTYADTDEDGANDAYSYSIAKNNYFYSTAASKAILEEYFDFTAVGSNTNILTATPKAYKPDEEGSYYKLTDGTYTNKAPGSEGAPTNDKYASTTQKYSPAVFNDTAAYEMCEKLSAVEGLFDSAPVAGSGVGTAKTSGDKAEITVPDAGYYFVTGLADALHGEDQNIVAAVALTTTEPTAEIKAKVDAPSVDKKVDTPLDTDQHENEKSIGDTVNYTIPSRVPDMSGYTEKYFFVMNDTLSKGLTLVDEYDPADNTKVNGFEITIGTGDTALTLTRVADANAAATAATNGNPYTYYVTKGTGDDSATTLKIVFNNFLQYRGDLVTSDNFEDLNTKYELTGANALTADNVGDYVGSRENQAITVKYSAILNDKAVLGNDGNTNDVELVYSNNPNDEGEGTPGKPDEPKEGDATGTTPKSETKTYVTGLELLKVDGNDSTKLKDVVFNITGTKLNDIKETTYNRYVKLSDLEAADFAGTIYHLLTDGTYSTDAIVTEGDEKNVDKFVKATEDHYAKMSDQEAMDATPSQTFYLKKDGTYTNTAPVTDGDTPTIDQYVSTDKWKKVTGDYYEPYKLEEGQTFSKTIGEEVSYQATTDANGVITLSGLGAGTYTITEIATNEGYNLLDQPITVVVTAETEDVTTGQGATAVSKTQFKNWKFQKDSEEATTSVNSSERFEIQIDNFKGTKLPSTGGIGTTLFYLIGGILIIGAGVLLVTRRRVDNAE